MAATFLASPGTEYGNCISEDCGHGDCVASRSMAATICTECPEPIGYNRHFYRNDQGLVHAYCETQRIAKGGA